MTERLIGKAKQVKEKRKEWQGKWTLNTYTKSESQQEHRTQWDVKKRRIVKEEQVTGGPSRTYNRE